MAEQTIWQLNISPGNSLATLKSLETALQSTKERITQVAAAGQNFDKLSTFQAKAAEAGKRLEIAQALAAQALKKADDAASGGKASAEKLATLQTKAALSAAKVESAEVAVANSMNKVSRESDRLTASLVENNTKTTLLSRGLAGAKASLASMSSTIQDVSVVALTALAAALVAVAIAIGSTIPKASKYEATLKQIYATNEITTGTVNDLSNSVLKMSGQVGKGPQDLADALYYVMGAGYDSASAMDILKRSAQQAAVGMTSTEVVANAATSVLKAFPALSTADAFDMMTQAVATGKTEWSTFGPQIGKVALFANAAGLSFGEASSALSVLTNVMPSTEQAATSLNALLQTSSRFSELSTRAKQLGLNFDENAYKTMSLVDRLRYLRDITDGNSESMNSLLGQEEAMPAINALLINDAADYSSALDKITNSSGAAETAWKKSSEGLGLSWDKVTSTLESLQVKIGMALIPVMKDFVENVAPVLNNIVDWIDKNNVLENTLNTIHDVFTNVSTYITQNIVPAFQNANTAIGNFTGTGNALQPVLAGLGAILLAVVIPAVGILAGEVIAVTFPFILIGLVVAGLTAIFLHFYNSNAGFRDFINGIGMALQQAGQAISTNFSPVMEKIGSIIQTQVWPALEQFGSFLSTTFKPVWDQLVATWEDQLLPSLNQLWGAIQNLMPVFQSIGTLIAVVVVVAFGILISIIRGVISALAPVISGIIQVFGGIVQVVTGIVQIISGIVMFIVDLFSGNFGKLGADLGMIWSGIVNGVMGFVGIFFGLWNMMINGVVALVSGFISGIIDFFTGLWDKLVGHSIIPDMVNGIIDWISQLPGRAFAFFGNLVSGAIDFFTNLKNQVMTKASEFVSGFIDQVSQMPGRAVSALSSLGSSISGVIQKVIDGALDWGSKIVNNIAQGIRNAVGFVTDAISSVTDTISSFFPHSPAKRGALKDLHLQGSLISEQVSNGMLAGLPKINDAIGAMTMPIIANLALPTPASPSFVASQPTGMNDNQVVGLLTRILVALESQGRQNNLSLNASVSGDSIDAQRINQLVQSLSGSAYEAISRGAY